MKKVVLLISVMVVAFSLPSFSQLNSAEKQKIVSKYLEAENQLFKAQMDFYKNFGCEPEIPEKARRILIADAELQKANNNLVRASAKFDKALLRFEHNNAFYIKHYDEFDISEISHNVSEDVALKLIQKQEFSDKSEVIVRFEVATEELLEAIMEQERAEVELKNKGLRK